VRVFSKEGKNFSPLTNRQKRGFDKIHPSGVVRRIHSQKRGPYGRANLPFSKEGVTSPFIKPTKEAKGSRAELVRYRLSDSTTEIKRDFILIPSLCPTSILAEGIEGDLRK